MEQIAVESRSDVMTRIKTQLGECQCGVTRAAAERGYFYPAYLLGAGDQPGVFIMSEVTRDVK